MAKPNKQTRTFADIQRIAENSDSNINDFTNDLWLSLSIHRQTPDVKALAKNMGVDTRKRHFWATVYFDVCERLFAHVGGREYTYQYHNI